MNDIKASVETFTWVPPVRKKGTAKVPSVYANIDWNKVSVSTAYVTDVKLALCEVAPSNGLMVVPVSRDM